MEKNSGSARQPGSSRAVGQEKKGEILLKKVFRNDFLSAEPALFVCVNPACFRVGTHTCLNHWFICARISKTRPFRSLKSQKGSTIHCPAEDPLFERGLPRIVCSSHENIRTNTGENSVITFCAYFFQLLLVIVFYSPPSGEETLHKFLIRDGETRSGTWFCCSEPSWLLKTANSRQSSVVWSSGDRCSERFYQVSKHCDSPLD